MQVVAAGLLNIYIFAGLAGPDGHQRVPVIGSGDCQGINGLVVQHLTDVGHGSGRVLAFFLDLGDPGGKRPGIWINQRHNLNPGPARQAHHVSLASTVEAGDRHPDGVVGADHPTRRLGSADGEAGPQGNGCAFQESTAIGLDHGRSGSSAVVLRSVGSPLDYGTRSGASPAESGTDQRGSGLRGAGPAHLKVQPKCLNSAFKWYPLPA